ncbi:MFS transporter [Kocuria dechangensis]|uniref:MFS transporter n=1 Tax=Kocuria dechangensis TaxID=1176249 RepID=A0A917LZI5_9MICC|nr:MFS transporter [Kocuria dechangensis]GGG65956.1 MFS transporter [Kocuria dechangensis]
MSTTPNRSDAPAIDPVKDKKQIRRVIASSYLGSTIEFYDFILYATAASLVFGPVFFANLDPMMATVASYMTFATGYLARPIGGVLFGHFGDRVGRKRMLLISMTTMGVVSVLIGFVPPIETWGAVMLLVLRALQGIAIGGEWGGAALMSLEHAETKSRGLAASFANAGGPMGAFLGTAALALFALLPEDDFLAWGWRIPFFFSAVLLVIGLYIRMKITESPVFEAAVALQDAGRAAKKPLPVLEVLRRPRTLLTVGIVGMGAFAIQALFSTFVITYAVLNGTDRSTALWAFAFSQLFATVTIPVFAALSDRFGRRPVMLAGLLLMPLLAFPLFSMLGSGQTWSVVVAFLVALSLFQSMTFGPMAAFLGENFSTTSRYTGASLGYQIAALLGGGFTPVFASTIFAAGDGDVTGVIWYLIGICMLSALVLIFLARESNEADIGPEDAQQRSAADPAPAGTH